MSDCKLQNILCQLSGLTTTELSAVKAAVNERLQCHLRTLSADGDLTEEEWKSLEINRLRDCVMLVRERIGLGLVDSKAYVDRARSKGRPRELHPLSSGSGPQHNNAEGPLK